LPPDQHGLKTLYDSIHALRVQQANVCLLNTPHRELEALLIAREKNALSGKIVRFLNWGGKLASVGMEIISASSVRRDEIC
jgi:hypothetical protein